MSKRSTWCLIDVDEKVYTISNRVQSCAPSIRSHRGRKVVWPDFQPIRVPEEPVCINLFRKKSSFYLPAFEISRSCRTGSVRPKTFAQRKFIALCLCPSGASVHKFLFLNLSRQHSNHYIYNSLVSESKKFRQLRVDSYAKLWVKRQIAKSRPRIET